MNPYRRIILFLALCIAMTAQAQDRTCYDRIRTQGIEDYNNGKYEDAIKKWTAAKSCSYVPGNNDLDSWIRKANDKLNAPPPPTRQPYEPEMVLVQGGTFQMGSNDGDDDEKPVHRVTVKDFYIGKYEVTQAQWRAVMGSDPPKLYNKGCDQCPVERVNWNDIQDFLKKLNAKTGKTYRLPTEAEWEYAARGGSKSKGYKYAGSNDLAEVAWYNANAKSGNTYGEQKTTRPVGTKKPNELGIHDMSGNVYEWVQDCWNDSYAGAPTDGSAWTSGNCNRRVLRGGSWCDLNYYCRVANRSGYYPGDRYFNSGFRLAQDR